MSRSSFTFSVDASLQKVGFMHDTGIVNINKSFGGGTLTLFISFDDGTTKDVFLDDAGVAYSKTAAHQFKFDLPIDDPDGLGAILYATLTGSTNPTVKVEILDRKKV